MKSKEELIAQFVPSGRIIDVGYAQQPNAFLRGEVYGVDIIQVAKPKNYIGVFKVDLNTDRLPFGDMSIDAVTMGCTLAHVANPLKVLAEINRVLKSGGVFVLSSPNPNYYWKNILNIFYYSFKERVSKAKHVEHFFEFSRYNMRTISERAGFKVLDEIGYLFALVKTRLRFNPVRYPGVAYEIIYRLVKIGEPQNYSTFEHTHGIDKIPTNFYQNPT